MSRIIQFENPPHTIESGGSDRFHLRAITGGLVAGVRLEAPPGVRIARVCHHASILAVRSVGDSLVFEEPQRMHGGQALEVEVENSGEFARFSLGGFGTHVRPIVQCSDCPYAEGSSCTYPGKTYGREVDLKLTPPEWCEVDLAGVVTLAVVRTNARDPGRGPDDC